MGGKAPDSPDYAAAAAAQGEASKEVTRDQTWANRPEQVTPWGSTNWNTQSVIDPSTGLPVTQWKQTTGLRSDLTDILDKQIGVQGKRSDLALGLTDRMKSEFGSAADYGGLVPMGERPYEQFTAPEDNQRALDYSGARQVGDPNDYRQRAEDAMYSKAESRLSPRFAQQREAMEVKLRNQGLGPEDQAYKAQMSGIDQQETDAYDQAQWGAIDAGKGEAQQSFAQDVTARNQGTSEADRMGGFGNQAAEQAFQQQFQANQGNYGQAMQGSNYANALRQQQIAETQGFRGQSLNEINALLNGQQVNNPSMPNFNTASKANETNYLGAAQAQGQSDLDAYNASQQAAQGWMSGATSLAAI